MLTLFEEVDALIGDLAASKAPAATRASGEQEEDENLTLLREIRDIVRHLAGEDLPADLAGGVSDDSSPKEVEPGIPVDAARAREEA